MTEDESFIIKKVSELEEKAKKDHEAFLTKDPPDFNVGAFTQLWFNHNALKEKLLESQREYSEQHSMKNINYRLYLDKVKEIDKMKKDYDRKINLLDNTINEMTKHIEVLSAELHNTQEKIKELETESED